MATCPVHFLTSRYYRKFLYFSSAGLGDFLQSLKALPEDPTIIMEDNQGAIALVKNPIAHARTKHIDIEYHYIREAIQEGLITLCYCPTNEIIAVYGIAISRRANIARTGSIK